MTSIAGAIHLLHFKLSPRSSTTGWPQDLPQLIAKHLHHTLAVSDVSDEILRFGEACGFSETDVRAIDSMLLQNEEARLHPAFATQSPRSLCRGDDYDGDFPTDRRSELRSFCVPEVHSGVGQDSQTDRALLRKFRASATCPEWFVEGVNQREVFGKLRDKQDFEGCWMSRRLGNSRSRPFTVLADLYNGWPPGLRRELVDALHGGEHRSAKQQKSGPWFLPRCQNNNRRLPVKSLTQFLVRELAVARHGRDCDPATRRRVHSLNRTEHVLSAAWNFLAGSRR